jgi:phenylacetic acid degradation operon negative regulatory protein
LFDGRPLKCRATSPLDVKHLCTFNYDLRSNCSREWVDPSVSLPGVTIAVTNADQGDTDSDSSISLPRANTGGAPQHLLVTLLGDYWLADTARVPAAALVEVMAEFGVSEGNARTALSRLSRRGIVVSERVGRRSEVRLSDVAAKDVSAGAGRIMRFGRENSPWDGRWTLAAFSLPEERRDVRQRLRSRLRWLGFAALFDGLWVCARAPLAELEELFRSHGVESFSVMRVVETSLGRPAIEAWDFSQIHAAYQQFLDHHQGLLERSRAGAIGPTEALVTRTRVMDAWRAFPAMDPALPDELLPENWPRPQARSLFVELYDRLGPLAELRVRQVVEQHRPELAALAVHHTSHAW